MHTNRQSQIGLEQASNETNQKNTHQEYRTHSPRQHLWVTPTCTSMWDLLIICYVSEYLYSINVIKTNAYLRKGFRQYRQYKSWARCVWENETRTYKQERQKREIQVNEVTAKPARWEPPTVWIGVGSRQGGCWLVVLALWLLLLRQHKSCDSELQRDYSRGVMIKTAATKHLPYRGEWANTHLMNCYKEKVNEWILFR